MTSSNCLLNNKAKNITSTTSCPKDTQEKEEGRYLNLPLINICTYIHLYIYVVFLVRQLNYASSQ